MSARHRWRLALLLTMALQALHAGSVGAQTDKAAAPAAAASAPAISNSAMDGQLLFEMLVSEMALGQGDAGTAYEWTLSAARRTRDETLFRRATDIALQARAGEQALAASRAWRLARPESMDALRLQLQILLLLNRPEALAEPLKTLLAQSPAADRPGLIAALPRFLQRANNPLQVAQLVEDGVRPYRDEPATRVASRVAMGRAWMEAREHDKALLLVQEAHTQDPTAPGPALLAMELMRDRPAAESVVQGYLRQGNAEPGLRMVYVRTLTAAQRYADAVVQLETATRLQPNEAGPFLSLGALHLELKQPQQGEAALTRYLELVQAAAPATAKPPLPPGHGAQAEDDPASSPEQGQVQAWLMLAQSAEQRRDFRAAEAWLARIEDPRRALEVQGRRASILARQGKVDEARELIRKAPERGTDDARAKVMAEAALLRDVKRWRDAFDVLAAGAQRFNDDSDIIYEQAMMAEKLERLDEMERLLRRVIELKPENAHAHNALGYSLADRKLRLPEARDLVQRALVLSPGDPFITDSLGWIEFRLGNLAEAARLLRQAYAARPDPEIGAHLGEVLWALGQQDEARRVWREARNRDAANDVLQETLNRLRAEP